MPLFGSSTGSFLIPNNFENNDAAVAGVVEDTSELLVTFGGGGGSAFTSGVNGDMGRDGEYNSASSKKRKKKGFAKIFVNSYTAKHSKTIHHCLVKRSRSYCIRPRNVERYKY